MFNSRTTHEHCLTRDEFCSSWQPFSLGSPLRDVRLTWLPSPQSPSRHRSPLSPSPQTPSIWNFGLPITLRLVQRLTNTFSRFYIFSSKLPIVITCKFITCLISFAALIVIPWYSNIQLSYESEAPSTTVRSVVSHVTTLIGFYQRPVNTQSLFLKYYVLCRLEINKTWFLLFQKCC